MSAKLILLVFFLILNLVFVVPYNQDCVESFDYDQYKYKILRYHQHISSNEHYLLLDDLEEHFTLFCDSELSKKQTILNQTYRSKLDKISS